MLSSIRKAHAAEEDEKQAKAIEAKIEARFAGMRQDLGEVFEGYAKDRGILLSNLNLLVGGTDLRRQSIPLGADPVTKWNISKANGIRAEIQKADDEFDSHADAILELARNDIEKISEEHESENRIRRAAAKANDIAEAETMAAQAQTSLEDRVQQLVPERASSVPPRQISVPASTPMSPAPSYNVAPLFGSLEEHRRLLSEQVDLWIMSTGRKRSPKSKGVRDVTDEFLKWRSAHKVGP